MKIENNTSKAKWIHYKINGVPKKVFLNAYDSYEERGIEDMSQLNMNSHDEILYEKGDRFGLGFKQRFSIGVYDKQFVTSYDQYQTLIGKPHLLQMFSGGTGYCAGKGSLFFSKTTDYGQNWIGVSPSPMTDGIYNMHFINPTSGVCVSWEGNVFITNDGASSWIKKTLPNQYRIFAEDETTVAYQSIFMKNKNEIFLAPSSPKMDAVLLRTIDGGDTWEKLITTADTNYSKIYKIKFYDNDLGLAVGSGGTIFKTTDGGSTWIDKSPDSNAGIYYSINIMDENCYWVAGGTGVILYSKDGGETWNKRTPSGVSSSIYDHYVCPSNGNIQFAVGITGNCVKSTNSGATFSSFIPMYRNGDGMSIAPVSENEIYTASGDYGFFLDRIDNLTSYTLITSAATYLCGGKVGGYFFQLGDDGYGRISRDSGATWSNYSNWTVSNVQDCYIVDENNVYTVENSSYFTHLKSGFTTNTRVSIAGLTSGSFIDKAPDGKIWVGGFTSKLCYSINSGATWTSITGITAGPRCISIFGNSIYVGAASASTYVSHNNGATWTLKNFLPSSLLASTSIYAFNESTAIVGTNYGSIYKTTDSGNTWNKVHRNSIYSNVCDLYYDDDSKIAMAITLNGYILSSKNQGDSWKTISKIPTYVWGTGDGDNGEILVFGGAGSTFSIKTEYVKII